MKYRIDAHGTFGTVEFCYTRHFDGMTRDQAFARFIVSAAELHPSDASITENGEYPQDRLPNASRRGEFCDALRKAARDGKFADPDPITVTVMEQDAPGAGKPGKKKRGIISKLSGGESSDGEVSGVTASLLLLAAGSLLFLTGCVASQDIAPGQINNGGATQAASTIWTESDSTIHTPDGAPNAIATPKIRSQSAVPRSELNIVLPDGREMSLASGSDGFSIESATYTEEGGERTYTLNIQNLSSSGRSSVIDADNASVALWTALIEAMSDDQRAVFEEAIDAGNSVIDALSLALGGV